MTKLTDPKGNEFYAEETKQSVTATMAQELLSGAKRAATSYKVKFQGKWRRVYQRRRFPGSMTVDHYITIQGRRFDVALD